MRVIIWGTGRYYEANKNIFRKNIDILGFIDNNQEKQGKTLDGKKIYAPHDINEIEFDWLFILCKDYVSVRRQLMDMPIEKQFKVYDVTQIEMLCDLPPAVIYDYSQHDNQKKKILVYSLSLSSTGAQNVMFIFLQSLLLMEKYDIIVVSKSDGVLRERLKEIGISVIITADFRYENPELSSYIEKADMILVNTIWLAYVVDDLRGIDKKVMWWLHESAMLSYIDVPCIKRNLNAKNVKVYAVSSIVKEYLEEMCHEKDTIELLPFGIPEYERRNGEKMIFAIIGGMGYIKGQDIFVDAVKCIPKQFREKAEFWIIGGGILEEKIKEKIEQLPEIIVKGEIDNRLMRYIYDSIDVVVSCSREESMSVVVMEGFMNEKMGIVSEKAGISDFITDGVDSFIVPNEDIEAFASKMIWAINHKDEVVTMGKKARKIYDRNFSMKAFENRIEKVMKEIISNY